MFKKALIVAASAVALSAPAFAGSIGTIQGTGSTNITSGTRTLTIQGDYSSEEFTVGAATEGLGASASAAWDPTTGPVLSVSGVGGASSNVASASFTTNGVANGSFLSDTQNSFTGTESVTSSGVFFNY